MKYIPAILIILILALLVFGGGAFYFAVKLTPDVIALGQETAKIRAEADLMQAKESYLQAQLAAKITLQDLQNAQEAKSTRLYLYSLAAGYAIEKLWLLWVMLSAISIAYLQRARWTPQQPFKAFSIETMIPASQAVALAKEALKIEELQVSQQMISAEAETHREHFQEILNAVKVFKNMVPKEKPATVIELPATDPAAALPVHGQSRYLLNDLLADPDLEPTNLPLGRTLNPGQLVQMHPAAMTTIDVIGKQHFCKTGILKMLTGGLFRLQDLGMPMDLYAFDIHAGWKDSFEMFLRPALGRFKQTVFGAAAFERGEHIHVLKKVVAELDVRQQTGQDTPLIVLLFDELQDTFDIEDYAKEEYKLLKKLRRARKGGVLEICVWHDSTKEGTGVGTGLMSLNVSAFVVNCGRTKAERVLEKGEAPQAINLERGLAVLKLPGADSEIVQLPFFEKTETVSKYFPITAPALSLVTLEAPGTTDAAESVETPDAEAALTPAAVRTFLDAHADLSQNKVADAAAIPRKYMSFWMNTKYELKPEEATRLRSVVFPSQTTNLVNLNQYRKTLEN